jgi:hypothetical protein
MAEGEPADVAEAVRPADRAEAARWLEKWREMAGEIETPGRHADRPPAPEGELAWPGSWFLGGARVEFLHKRADALLTGVGCSSET